MTKTKVLVGDQDAKPDEKDNVVDADFEDVKRQRKKRLR